MDERLERSISTGVTSKPASFIVLAIACAFSNYLSPTTIFIPAPMRRAMAVPIWFFNRAFGTNFMFLMRAGEGNPLKLFERFGSHLLGYPVLLAVVFAVMYLLLRVLRRRTAVPAGK